MPEILAIIIHAIWLMLPAYVANPTAVVFGGGTPIDLGRHWFDGKRILGDGKTYRGLLGGIACGILIGLIQIQVSPAWFSGYFTVTAVVSLSAGALLGDIVKSFFKRRLGFVRGAKVPLVDQLDFVAGALILAYAADPRWFTENVTIWIFITVIILTPIFHRLTNMVGYSLKLKKEPW